MTKSFERLLNDADIERTACELLGVVAARVFLWRPRRDPLDEGPPATWIGLWTRPTADAEWELVGLRRTRVELLKLIESRATAAANRTHEHVSRGQHVECNR